MLETGPLAARPGRGKDSRCLSLDRGLNSMGVGVLFFPCPLKVILLKVTTSESHLIKGKFPQHLPETQMEGAGVFLSLASF